VPAGRDAPRRNEAGHQALQALDGRCAILPGRRNAVKALGQQVGQRGEVPLHGRALLPVLIDHLHEGAKTDGDQERYDQRWHSAAKCRLRYQQPMIGRFRDRLRQPLD